MPTDDPSGTCDLVRAICDLANWSPVEPGLDLTGTMLVDERGSIGIVEGSRDAVIAFVDGLTGLNGLLAFDRIEHRDFSEWRCIDL